MDDDLVASQLRALDDIVEPAPISYLPQTWGWAVLAVLLLFLLILAARHGYRHWHANRYRRAALAEIDGLERQARLQPSNFPIEATLTALLKRTALAAWPRTDVASLNGRHWVQFLTKHAPRNRLDEPLASFLEDKEYRRTGNRPADILKLLRAAREWIEGHHV